MAKRISTKKPAPVATPDFTQKAPTIEAAVKQVSAQKAEITPSEQAHLQKVFADLEQARTNFTQAQQVIAQAQSNLAAAEGAQTSFIGFLSTTYDLSPVDSIDVQTGRINRKAQQPA
jgi:hypothetical protein